MPIDTAAKRRSAGSVAGVPWVAGVTPDTTKPVAWRQQAGWGYSGITISETELTSDLWAYYRFSNNLRDTSGNDRHLTTDLGATYQAGKINRALATEGGSTTTVPTGTLATHSYSISVWMHATHAAAGNGAIVGWDRFYLRHIEPGGTIHYVQFVGEGMAGAFPGQVTLVHDDWNHVVVTWSHVTQRRKIYVNGVLADNDLEPTPGTSAFTSTFADATDDFSSGLDEVGLYTRELSADEVEALYNDGDGFDPTIGPSPRQQEDAVCGVVARSGVCGTITRSAVWGY